MARGEKIWVVRAGDGASLADILQRMRRPGDDDDAAVALEQGRVFIGKKRALRSDQAVRVGDAVRIGPPPRDATNRKVTRESTSNSKEAIEILFHEHGLLAVNKPAGLPTVPDHAGASHSLVSLAAASIGVKSDELRVTSRLDRDVSGVVVFALDANAEERLRSARAEGKYQRRYIALAHRGKDDNIHAAHSHGVWSAPIGRSTADPRLRAVNGPDAKAATTHWQRIATATAANVVDMLAIDPMTGRTHQIRVHASDGGSPLVGDLAYGALPRIVLEDGRVLSLSRIALHAARVVVPNQHGAPIAATAPVSEELARLWTALGGEPEAWNRAVACEIPRETSINDRSGEAES